MIAADVGSTSSTQLRAIRDWRNNHAWVDFQRKYDPFLRSCCQTLRLDERTADEVCQLTWIEVARRMKSFVYDPQKSFRGWLYTVCTRKARDYLKKTRNHAVFSLEERDEASLTYTSPSCREASMYGDDGQDENTFLTLWLRRAEEVQAAVRARVQPQTWEAFWLLAVSDWGLEETVQALGISHASAYKAKERVIRRLQEEGRRVYGDGPESIL